MVELISKNIHIFFVERVLNIDLRNLMGTELFSSIGVRLDNLFYVEIYYFYFIFKLFGVNVFLILWNFKFLLYIHYYPLFHLCYVYLIFTLFTFIIFRDLLIRLVFFKEPNFGFVDPFSHTFILSCITCYISLFPFFCFVKFILLFCSLLISRILFCFVF